ncbi:unnamed protein product [Polarella glacialis]|uniref:Uncharacterized protein n=1 Tax=Polarella glacialis TaxID=89957 RepID=A0A813K8E1_POLGL|nr:unnamed protein product [Polarella glacialis]
MTGPPVHFRAEEEWLGAVNGPVLVLRGLRCRGVFVDPPAGVQDYQIQADEQPMLSLGQLVIGLHEYYSQWHDPWCQFGRRLSRPLLRATGDGTWCASYN